MPHGSPPRSGPARSRAERPQGADERSRGEHLAGNCGARQDVRARQAATRVVACRDALVPPGATPPPESAGPRPHRPSPPAPPPPPGPPWSLDDVPRPWTGEAILAYIQAGLDPDGRLRDDHLQLPDEPPDTGQLRWAPGALDGVVTTHASSKDGAPETVIAAILALADHADAATLAATAEVLRTTEIRRSWTPSSGAWVRRPIPTGASGSARSPGCSPTRPPNATSSSSGSR